MAMKRLFLTTSAAVLILGAGLAGVHAQSYDPNTASATEVRFQELEQEIRRLTAQVEEQSYQIRQLREELARITGDMQVRLDDIQQGRSPTGAVSPAVSPYATAGATPSPGAVQPYAQDLPPEDMVTPDSSGRQPVEDDPSASFSYSSTGGQATPSGQNLGTLNVSGTNGAPSNGTNDPAASAYDYAFSYVKARNFDRAEQEFAKFIQTFPDSAMIPNAKYWYAETFYVRGNYAQAAKLFAEGYQKEPKGSKAPSNLLKLGMSLAGLDRKDDACVAFKQLQKDYSGTSAPILNRGKTEMERIGCQ